MKSGRYLLDTHCLLWFQENNPAIPNRVMQIIQDPLNIIFFSQISLFEITIKQSIGKLPLLKASIEEIYKQALEDNFTFISLENQHLYKYKKVPFLENHRDPFDRMLIATAIHQNVVLISADKSFKQYSQKLIEVYW